MGVPVVLSAQVPELNVCDFLGEPELPGEWRLVGNTAKRLAAPWPSVTRASPTALPFPPVKTTPCPVTQTA